MFTLTPLGVLGHLSDMLAIPSESESRGVVTTEGVYGVDGGVDPEEASS